MSHYTCRICRSSYRKEIEQLLSQKLQYRQIARKYHKFFSVNLHLSEQSIGTHHKKHLPREVTEEEKVFLGKLAKGEATFDDMSKIIEQITFENMLKNPRRARFSHYIKLQELQIRKEKIKQKNFGQWGL